jgi:hypothetical protein
MARISVDTTDPRLSPSQRLVLEQVRGNLAKPTQPRRLAADCKTGTILASVLLNLAPTLRTARHARTAVPRT